MPLLSIRLCTESSLACNQALGLCPERMIEGSGVGSKVDALKRSWRPVLCQPETTVQTVRRMCLDSKALNPKRGAAVSALAMVDSS